MTRSVLNLTKWLWCLVALQYGTVSGVENQSVQKNPPGNPTTVEAQAKFFQDFFSVQLSPYKIEFGHVCEDPNTWEQRYEAKDYKNHRDMGKVRWGDKKGGYGEHYWDLNHAGHNNDHDNYGNDNDDGSYHHQDGNDGNDHNDGNEHNDGNDHNDAYDEPSEPSPSYENGDTGAYDVEKASLSPYDEAGRAKRAHPRIKPERKVRHTTQKPIEEYEEEEETQTYRPRRPTKEKTYKNQNEEQTYHSEEIRDDDTSEYDTEPTTEEPVRKPIFKYKKVPNPEELEETPELKDIYKYKKVRKPVEPEENVPELKEEVKDELKESLYTPRKQVLSQSVPYEQGGEPLYTPRKQVLSQSVPYEQGGEPLYTPRKQVLSQSVSYEQGGEPLYTPRKQVLSQSEQGEESLYTPRKLVLSQSVPYEQGGETLYTPRKQVLSQSEQGEESLYTPRKQVLSQSVPYEQGGGVIQHYPAASRPVPRLFLEPTTGHVVDRTTGQAYILQPILANYNQ